MAIVYLGLGSNLGDRAANLRLAVDKLDSGPVRILRTSFLYETNPVGVTEQPVADYLNCAVESETNLTPSALLFYVKNIERSLGRFETFRWGPRVIDIDILLFEDVTLDSEELSIPHPRLCERKFVLIPLLELNPDLTLPDGRRLASLLDSSKLADQSIRKIRESIAASKTISA